MPTMAASASPKRVIAHFQTYLNKAEATYKADYQKAKSQYESTLSSKEIAITQAKKDYVRFGQVRVVKLGDNRNYWGSFNCPTARPNCIYVDKGEKFEVGEVTSIKEAIANDLANLDLIDIIVNLGLVELINPSELQKAARIIREETYAVQLLKKKYDLDIKTIEGKYEKQVLVEPAVLAAKRASKNASDFHKAFITALKFEHNKQRLDELARLPFRYIDSFKALDSAIKVTRLSEQADRVDSSYSYSGAKKINSICGKTFIAEAEFMEMFLAVSEVYKQVSGRKLTI